MKHEVTGYDEMNVHMKVLEESCCLFFFCTMITQQAGAFYKGQNKLSSLQLPGTLIFVLSELEL